MNPKTLSASENQLITDWLNTKQSPHTRRVYYQDFTRFFSDLNLELGEFLAFDRHKAFELVSRYKGQMMQSGLKSPTINGRLAVIKSLVSFAYNCGYCEFMIDTIKGEKIELYRDTTGIDPETFKQVLGGIDRTALKGIRDYALLMLLWSNALRRSEVSQANISDFDPTTKTLRIFGKGRGNNSEIVSLGKATVTAIEAWLEARGEHQPDKALFVSVNPGYRDGRLSTQAIYTVVKDCCKDAGKLNGA